MKTLRPWLFSIGMVAASITHAQAMDGQVHGALKNETAYFIGTDKRFDKIQNRLDVKPELRWDNNWEFRGRILSWYDAAMDVKADNATDLSPGIQRYYRTHTETKEAYLLYAGADYDFRIGQQQIVWGKTDGLRMLDMINPLDMREFLLDDFLDSRIGLWAARLNYYAYLGDSEHEFEFIVTPDAQVNRYAPTGSRWAITPVIPAGMQAQTGSNHAPNWASKNTEYGAAWRSNQDGWDVSLNWFYGWNDNPVMRKTLLNASTLLITPYHKQSHTIGGSFSNAFGPWVLRGELAGTLDEPLALQGLSTATNLGHRSTWSAALGLDYQQNNWRISPQYFIRSIKNWNPNMVEDRFSGFASLLLATDFMNEKLKPEIIAMVDWSNGSWMIRPKASYEISDAITMRLGMDVFTGSGGMFGSMANNDRVYAEWEFGF